MALITLPRPPEAEPAVVHPDSFVSAARGFAYLCVPKTLSRAMLQYLETVDPTGRRVAERGRAALAVPAASGDPLLRFSFVRNPYSRVVATYYNKFVHYVDTPGQKAMFARHPGLRPDMTLAELVDWLTTDAGDDRRTDPHFRSQLYYLYDVSGAPAVDLIGRMEDAATDVADLQRRLGLEVAPLPRVNANVDLGGPASDTSRRWREMLDDDAIRALTGRYEADFALFGYERLPYKIRPLFSQPDAPRTPPPRPTVGARVRAAAKRTLASLGFELRRTRTPGPQSRNQRPAP